MEDALVNKLKKLLNQVREQLLLMHYSIRTEEACLSF